MGIPPYNSLPALSPYTGAAPKKDNCKSELCFNCFEIVLYLWVVRLRIVGVCVVRLFTTHTFYSSNYHKFLKEPEPEDTLLTLSIAISEIIHFRLLLKENRTLVTNTAVSSWWNKILKRILIFALPTFGKFVNSVFESSDLPQKRYAFTIYLVLKIA